MFLKANTIVKMAEELARVAAERCVFVHGAAATCGDADGEDEINVVVTVNGVTSAVSLDWALGGRPAKDIDDDDTVDDTDEDDGEEVE